MGYAYLVLGLVTGVFSGIFGLGGGIILIPALVFIFKMTQHQAQGTTLAAMIPPIGLLAAIEYYKAGHINVKIAALVALGFFLGGYFGGKYAQSFSDPVLKKSFAMLLVGVGIYMFFGK
jgi:hypothetical protein